MAVEFLRKAQAEAGSSLGEVTGWVDGDVVLQAVTSIPDAAVDFGTAGEGGELEDIQHRFAEGL